MHESPTAEELRAERERLDEILQRGWPTGKSEEVVRKWKMERDQALQDLDRLKTLKMGQRV